MEKIVTQDVYLQIERETNSAVCRWDEKWLEWKMLQYIEKHSNMVVLTEEQYEADKRKTAEDAYTVGAEREYELSVHGCSSEPDKEQYLTELFGGGETRQK